MITQKTFWTRSYDGFWVLIGLFVVSLVILFRYLMLLDYETTSRDITYQKINQLTEIDANFERFLTKVYRANNYQEVEEWQKKFDEALEYLIKNQIDLENSGRCSSDLEKIKRLYEDKKLIMMEFRNYNQRILPDLRSLYAVYSGLKKLEAYTKEQEEHFEKIFLEIGETLVVASSHEGFLEYELDAIKRYTTIHPYYQEFYNKFEKFIFDIRYLGDLSGMHDEDGLHEAIKSLSNFVTEEFYAAHTKQKNIATVFFILSFLILFLLLYKHIVMRQASQELYRFRYAVENSDNMIIIATKEKKVLYANNAFEKISGYSKKEILGKNPNILKSNLHKDEFYEDMNRILESGKKWQGHLVNMKKDGSILHEQASIIPIIIDDEVVEYVAIKLDITEMMGQQKQLQQSAIVYETISDGVVISDFKKRIVSVNPAFIEMFGYERAEIEGARATMFASTLQDVALYNEMWSAMKKSNKWSGKIHNKTKDGKNIPIWLTTTVVKDENGKIQNFISIYVNLGEIIQMQEKADFLAYHDSLTLLHNRAYFDKQIESMLSRVHDSDQELAVIFIDLDRFKSINDTLGHHIGDQMLIEVGRRLRDVLGAKSILARIGGDEFVVILEKFEGKEEVANIAQKLLEAIRKPIVIDEYSLSTTLSIGISLYPQDGEDRNTIIKHADSAMYRAKELGKDTFQFYTKQLSIDAQKRHGIEQEITNAIKNGELSLHFQPQCDLRTGQIIAAEALLRWDNPRLGSVLPEQFISIAEETGEIIGIGYFVLEESCRNFAEWQKENLQITMVSVNVSSVQLRQKDIVSRFQTIVELYGLSPSSIDLEITEGHIMEYTTSNLTALEDFKKLGFHIAIDDFGTGYSSMSYMKSLPLDTIKIDKSFVDSLPEDIHDVEITKAIIALSKSLGYRVIAEGIENLEQVAFLMENGCDLGQGYYFGSPIAQDEFVGFVKKYNESVKTKPYIIYDTMI